MAIYPMLVACLVVFIVISWRRRDRALDGRPDVSDTERNVAYACASIAVVLVLLTLVL